MRRRGPAGETRHRQIKATPEKMHGTAFATETRPEFLQHTIALNKDAPEPIGIFAIVRAMLFILIERDRILNFVRRSVDGYWQLQFVQRRHDRLVKICHAPRLLFDRAVRAVALQNAKIVVDEIEINLESIGSMRNRRSRQAA